jgi:hypothetical protein
MGSMKRFGDQESTHCDSWLTPLGNKWIFSCHKKRFADQHKQLMDL